MYEMNSGVHEPKKHTDVKNAECSRDINHPDNMEGHYGNLKEF